jgi:phenylalanyl-tRNA synthetase beta chain
MLNMSFTSVRLNTLLPGLDSAASPVDLLNPLSAEDAQMRLSLLSNLMRALQLNVRQGETGVAAFELGKVFSQGEGVSVTEHKKERLSVAGVLYGRWPVTGIQQEGQLIDFTDLKGVIETLCQELHYPITPPQCVGSVPARFLSCTQERQPCCQ